MAEFDMEQSLAMDSSAKTSSHVFAFIIPMRIKGSSMSVIVKPIAESKPGMGCFEWARTAPGPGR